jgi:hypothetical protein
MSQSFPTIFTSYQFAAGFDNVGGLASLDPQPSCPGLLYNKWTQTINGHIYGDGLYTEWRYSALPTDKFYALLQMFGITILDGVLSAEGTFHLKLDDNTTYMDFNGVIAYPRPEEKSKRQFGRQSDIVFTISNLRPVE